MEVFFVIYAFIYTFSGTYSGKTIPSLAHILCVKNPTHSGIEMWQKGTLAVLHGVCILQSMGVAPPFPPPRVWHPLTCILVDHNNFTEPFIPVTTGSRSRGKVVGQVQVVWGVLLRLAGGSFIHVTNRLLSFIYFRNETCIGRNLDFLKVRSFNCNQQVLPPAPVSCN